MEREWSEDQIEQEIENLRECSRVSSACRWCSGDPTLCEQNIFLLMQTAADMLDHFLHKKTKT